MKVLKESALFDGITGGIYTAGERPDNSNAEDIVINNISFEHSTPKRGVSNINIHIPDIAVQINGTPQFKTNRERLQEITQIVTSIIETTTIEGVGLHIDATQVFAEPNAHEHYMNIRASWLIAKPTITDLDIRPNPLLQRIVDLERRVATLEQTLQAETTSETNQEPLNED